MQGRPSGWATERTGGRVQGGSAPDTEDCRTGVLELRSLLKREEGGAQISRAALGPHRSSVGQDDHDLGAAVGTVQSVGIELLLSALQRRPGGRVLPSRARPAHRGRSERVAARARAVGRHGEQRRLICGEARAALRRAAAVAAVCAGLAREDDEADARVGGRARVEDIDEAVHAGHHVLPPGVVAQALAAIDQNRHIDVCARGRR